MNFYEFSLTGILPYIIVTVLLFAIQNMKINSNKKAWYCFWILFLFAAIRYGIGYDYYGYMACCKHLVQDYTIDRFEPLSRVLVEVSYRTHFQVFFIISSFLTIFPVFLACKKLSVNPAFSLLIFFLHPSLYLNSLSIVRNAIAISIVLYAIVLLVNKKLKWSICLIIVAMLFHKSAFIAFLIYPLYYIKINRKMHLMLYIVSFALSVWVANVITQHARELVILQYAEHYIVDKAGEGGGTLTYIVNGLCLYNFIIWEKISKMNKMNAFFLASYNIGCCIWNVFLSLDSTLANRLSLFFLQSIILIVPYYQYVEGVKNAQLIRKVTLAFFTLLYTSYFIINISAYIKDPTHRMSNIPYQTIFYHNDYSNYVY